MVYTKPDNPGTVTPDAMQHLKMEVILNLLLHTQSRTDGDEIFHLLLQVQSTICSVARSI